MDNSNLNLPLDLEYSDETLDEEEFNIPKCSLPTLESILAEDDDFESAINLDDFTSNVIKDDISSAAGTSTNLIDDYQPPELEALKNWETTSIASNESKPTREKKKKSVHGSVISVDRVSVLSESLTSNIDRINAGSPTVMALSSFVAVGTSRGIVMVFDSSQKLKSCLGSASVGEKFGGVSAVCFNSDSTRLLAGYSRGQILMYDVTNNKLLRTITDAHPPGTAVLHVKFTDDLTLAVCNDSGGSVFELNFRRVMGVRTCDSRCLFSGSRGEVCTIEPLHFPPAVADHPLRDRHLLAMGTLTKIFVVSLRPKTKVLFLHRLDMNPASGPLLSWKLNPSRINQSRLETMLMFGRGDVIYFFQVICGGLEDVKFVHLRTMNLTFQIINFAWMNLQTILLVDTREQLHVIDVDSQEDLEVKTADHISLVYNNATFKSIATGSNVSLALAKIGEHACYGSLVSNGRKVFLLGTRSVFVVSINHWKDRINIALTHSHQFALQVALSFYNESAKAVEGLPLGGDVRRQIISDLMLDILVEFVDLSMTTLCPDSGKLQVLIEFYRQVVPVCVDHCLNIDRIDILFTRIYERFKDDCISHGSFLECLEPYILNDRIKTVNPQVMKEFIEHYRAKNMLESVEKCLLHLNVESLDLNQVMHICWGFGLYDAIISIYNRGMKDFTTPFLELLFMLQSSLNSSNNLSDKMTSLGNKLLVYLSCCLSGVAYPVGILDPETSTSVKDQMIVTLLTPFMTDKGFIGMYPVIHTLLKFSTKELFNVLFLSFGSDLIRQEPSLIQQVVDILLQVMVEKPGFTPEQIGLLFTFLARQSARQKTPLHLTSLLRQQVVEFLTTPSDNGTIHEERQQALIELLRCGVIVDENSLRLVSLAERASFFKVLKILHEQKRRYDQVFLAYLRDTSQGSDVFKFITDSFSSSLINEEEKTQIKIKVIEHICDLIKIDSCKTAFIFIEVLHEKVQLITEKLREDPKMLFNFLRGLFEKNKSTLNDVVGFSMETHFGEDTEEDARSSTFTEDPHLSEMYLDLLCRFDSEKVLAFVTNSSSIRIQNALEIVLRNRVDDASAFLLEKNNDVSAAFNILKGVFKEKLDLLDDVGEDQDLVEDAVKTSMMKVIVFCQRNSKKMIEKQREKLWFSLLDIVMKPREGSDQQIFYKSLAKQILNSMIGHTSLSNILQKIIQNPIYKSGEFSEIKNLLIGMLETYQYEKTLIGTTLHLLSRDRYNSLHQLKSDLSYGIAPRSQYCALCRNPLLHASSVINETQKMVIFSFGTQYHCDCLSKDISPQLNYVEKDKLLFTMQGKKDTRGKGEIGFLPTVIHNQYKESRPKSNSIKLLDDFEEKKFSLNLKHPSISF